MKSYQTAGPIGTKFGTYSSGNGHRLNTIRPSIPRGISGGFMGSQIQKYWEAVKRLDTLAPNVGTHVQIHLGMDIRQTYCPSRNKGALGVLGGQQLKNMEKLSDWHQRWFTSADSSGKGHMLHTSRPSIPQGSLRGGGGVEFHKFKSIGKLLNGWTDWHQIWHTSADPSGNGYTPNKLPLETQGGHVGY